ncbi:MAG: hypothetical protein M1822_008837 [Bathelium mastoideum]|nr:MAG: hypothetical protein M1822_008837 [Bathelium mastoideum]
MVSGTVGKKMLYASWAGIAFTAIYGIAFIIELCTSCQPLDAYWKSYDLNYKGPFKCRRPGASEPISGALSVASDFYAVVLPFLLVRNLQIPDRQRYGLYLVFGFGMIIVGCGIARTVYLDRVANRSYDTTWVGFDAFAASLLESQLSIIGACLPNLRKVFGAYFGESLSKVYSNLKNSRQKTFGSSKDSKNLSDREQDTMKEKNMTSVTEDIELTAFSEKMWRDPGTQGTLRSAADHEYFEKAYVKRFGSNTVGEDDLPKPEESAISKPSYPMFRHSVF